MKKIIFIFLTFMLILTGCGKYGEKDVLRDLNKKISNLKSYYIEGKMEIINNEDIYKYDVKVSYKEKDNYKVSLKNESNNHEQIILKNSDGVYVLTPSLNKSFKFESEWPYKNSQIYLLQSLLNDINNDKDIEFESNNEKYKITTTVDYPNNRALVKQNIYLDTKLNVKEVQVLNNEGVAEIKMTFQTIDQNPSFNDDYFSLKQNMETTIIDEEVNEVLEIDDTVFPMYLPENTSLEDQNTIQLDKGERVILTFAGEKPFVLIEETASKEEELEIIPTIGEPTILTDTIGFVSENSVSWISKGMQFYIASEELSKDEMISVAKSISSIPVMK